MTTAISEMEDLKLTVTQEIRVDAPIDVTFEALLEQLGPCGERPDGEPMPLTLEAWPGGRWYRDLGEGNGHFWGVVQAIKRPTLLEMCGPLFMSYPVVNNVQYRLRAEGDSTVIQFHHLGLGLIDEAHRKGVVTGWSFILEQAAKRAEQAKAKAVR